ncbi:MULTISPECIES: nucleoside-diphosphate sugar epimerase/dehydratase [Citrobacter]|uniref:polysaccharide biosynthesis protein n=1 Tax=Citrobacter TaxID=544 RepID=UPI001BCF237A|nr:MULTISPECIES: nucleoside-diphosphate sugar epimerase/dehydratase [Citrobacter]MDM3070063.1 polysaccharide biosynthesis protein [Citrobacter sp. Cf224]HCB1602210.1 polysaccharide biosynthesis protein [Citrobacter freundii]HCB1723297.1 polysaccharide biosynthesis protein [Citrobacter freundii]HCB1876983.1 polysaccharide biosynthesis protein [Citrobacter freundii]HDS6879828.1 polysaccharide biosynthesis protein [Citrobacter freundii]
MLTQLLSLPRNIKRIIMVAIDFILLLIAFWGAFWVRMDISAPYTSYEHWKLLACLIAITVFIFIKMGLYRTVLRYVTAKIFVTVLFGMCISTLFLITMAYFFDVFLPRAVPIIYFAFSLLFICGSRLFFRMMLTYAVRGRVPVIIYGAGASGRQLLTALRQVDEYFPVAFVDDNPLLSKVVIHGVTVYPRKSLEKLIPRYGIKKILLAMPSISVEKRREVITNLENFPCEVLSIPGMVDLVEGKAQIMSLKKVSIDDLLGREPVAPSEELLAKNIRGKVVMVTGAGGSIGSEICRQIITQKPKILILFEVSEFALYSIEKELSMAVNKSDNDIVIIPLMGSVQKLHRLETIMRVFNVNTVYHAAAYKHVPLVEYNVVEGVRNNIYGTFYCAKAAISSQVETFILVSTDKAVRPTNTMGATKRVAELVLQALAKEQSVTCFSMVRFGNVLGSSGSVVPLFEKQIEKGGPVTLTHKDIIRYFMTIPEASQLVIQAGAMARGGDVFVLDMGDPVRIYDLATRMVKLSGLTIKDESNPDGDIEICITGLRPGEKLYEELLIGEQVLATTHPRIMTAHEDMLSWQELEVYLKQMDEACNNFEHDKIRELLLKIPTGFQPTDGICDLVWHAKNNALESNFNVTC